MGHSFVSIVGGDLRLSDVDLQATLCVISDAAGELQAGPGATDAAYWAELAKWLPMARTAAPGCMYIDFDRVLDTPERVERTAAVLARAEQLTCAFGGALPVDYLNAKLELT